VPGGAIQNVVQRRLCWVVENADQELVDDLLVSASEAPDVLKEALFRKLLATSRFDDAVRLAGGLGWLLPVLQPRADSRVAGLSHAVGRVPGGVTASGHENQQEVARHQWENLHILNVGDAL
jgi:hypothetical protein